MIIRDRITSFELFCWLGALSGIQAGFYDVEEFVDGACHFEVAAEDYGLEFADDAAMFAFVVERFGGGGHLFSLPEHFVRT